MSIYISSDVSSRPCRINEYASWVLRLIPGSSSVGKGVWVGHGDGVLVNVQVLDGVEVVMPVNVIVIEGVALGAGLGVSEAPGGWVGGIGEGPMAGCAPQAARLAPTANTAAITISASSFVGLPPGLRLRANPSKPNTPIDEPSGSLHGT